MVHIHIQGIERMWVEDKSTIKKHRRATHMLQDDLDERSWRKRNGNDECTLMEQFLTDIHGVPNIMNLL